MSKKSVWNRRKIYQQRNAEIQNKTYISAEVFFFLTCDQAFFVFFLRGGLDPVATQSNHLLGNPRYTLTERLLANLTHLRFAFGFCLARKNGFESVWFFHLTLGTGQISRTLLPGLSRQSSAVSESRSDALKVTHTMLTALNVWKIIMGYPRNSWSVGRWMPDFQENI